jgi:hypothetical protein
MALVKAQNLLFSAKNLLGQDRVRAWRRGRLDRMIRIAITQAAFDAIAATLPVGSTGYVNAVNDKGERLIWLVEPNAGPRARTPLAVRITDRILRAALPHQREATA